MNQIVRFGKDSEMRLEVFPGEWSVLFMKRVFFFLVSCSSGSFTHRKYKTTVVEAF